MIGSIAHTKNGCILTSGRLSSKVCKIYKMLAKYFFKEAKRLKDLKLSNSEAFAEFKKQSNMKNNQVVYGICLTIDKEFEKAGEVFAAIINTDQITNARFLLTFIFRQDLGEGKKVVQEMYKHFSREKIAGVVARAAIDSAVAKYDREYAINICKEAIQGKYTKIAGEVISKIEEVDCQQIQKLRNMIVSKH